MGCQIGVPGGKYPPKKYPSAPPGDKAKLIANHSALFSIIINVIKLKTIRQISDKNIDIFSLIKSLIMFDVRPILDRL